MQKLRRRIRFALLAVAAGACLQPGAVAGASEVGAQEQGPQQLVAELATRLFATLDREREAFRREPNRLVPHLAELLSPHFDADYTARLVLGAHWRAATPQDRQRFAAALYGALLRTYAGSVAEWTPEKFRLLPLSGDAAALQVTVRTQVMRPSGSYVSVDYRLHRTAEAWKVFDVIVDGVSYVRTHHDDVDADISQRGLDFAVARLEQRNPGTEPRAAPASPDPGAVR